MVARLAVGLLLLAGSLAAQAQPAAKHYRIGFVGVTTATALEPLRQGLRELGYVEGKNITVEARFAGGKQEALPQLIAEVLGRNVDVLVVGSTRTALEAKKATSSVPIVFSSVFDPVASGIVPNLARPGGNLTGIAMGVGGDYGAKWVELLKEAVPRMQHAAVLWNSTNPSSAQSAQAIEAAARDLGVKLALFDAGTGAALDAALKGIAASRVQGLIIAPDPLFTSHRTKLIRFAAAQRLPAVYFFRSFADAGGLMAYGANSEDSTRAAAAYVDKILRGAKAGDLPVSQPTRFELTINLKTAQALGVKIPKALLVRADHVIQ